MKIAKIFGRQILDSRGNPTVETELVLANGQAVRTSVPSGASTGRNEALELRDGDPHFFGGEGVLKAVDHINREIAPQLIGMDVTEQSVIDERMCTLDGTENKARLGANAILSVSLAALHAGALAVKLPLYRYVARLADTKGDFLLPLPMMNVINGGKHATGSTDIQEFMLLPVGARTFAEALRMGAEIFHTLKEVLHTHGYASTVGDEGGYAPAVHGGNHEALDLMQTAVSQAGYRLGEDICFAVDVAASELFESGRYNLKTENKTLTTDEMIAWLGDLSERYPILSIEDGLSQDDWAGWTRLTEKLHDRVYLVGDDLLVTNTKFLRRGIQERAANAILIKVNQIGTVSETLQAIQLARSAGWRSIISHRSGETEDTTIAHLAVGCATGLIKTGSLSRGERIAKYNELLRIEEELGRSARYAGREALSLTPHQEA